MSFTSIVKNEVSKLEISDIEKIAELSAIISSAANIDTSIKITSENASVARHIFGLIKDLYQITPNITMRKGTNLRKNSIFILQIKSKVDYILKDIGLKEENKNYPFPLPYILDDEESQRAFLRGIFYMCGSINDPKKSRYHLEFLVDTKEFADNLNILLQKYHLNSKILKRENKYMVYIKEAEKIGDFLRIINAYNAVLYFEDIRIYRDHKNMTNRLNNCEQANMDRIIETANQQANDIEYIKEALSFDLLDEKEQIVAEYRLKYREVSLLELSEIITVETGQTITKSGLYHRFKKISALADKLRENSKK